MNSDPVVQRGDLRQLIQGIRMAEDQETILRLCDELEALLCEPESFGANFGTLKQGKNHLPGCAALAGWACSCATDRALDAMPRGSQE